MGKSYLIGNIVPRVTTIVSSATPTVNTDLCDAVNITALAVNITSMTTNLSGMPDNFQMLVFRISDNGSARTISWGASFVNMGAVLPVTTTIGSVLTVLFQYNTVLTKWGCIDYFDAVSGVDWLLGGNTVGAEKNIGTIDNFSFPLITNSVERMRIANTGSVGIGMTPDPSVRLDIQAANTGSGSYGLRIQDSTGTNNGFVVRNDSKVAINSSSFLGALTVDGTNNNPVYFIDNFPRLIFRRTTADGIAAASIKFETSTGGQKWNITTNNAIGSDKFEITDATLVRLIIEQGGNIGLSINSPSARLHIIGSGTTSSTYTLKVCDSSAVEIFSVRDDGVVFINCSLRINSAQTTVNGSTSGNAIFSQPQSGATNKEILVFFGALLGTATYTFPVAFVKTPSIVATNDVAAGIVTSLSTTAVTVTGATTNGFIKLIGY